MNEPKRCYECENMVYPDQFGNYGCEMCGCDKMDKIRNTLFPTNKNKESD